MQTALKILGSLDLAQYLLPKAGNVPLNQMLC